MDNTNNLENTAMPKENFEFSKTDLILIPFALLIGYLMNALVWGGDYSLGVVLFIASAFVLTFWYVKKEKIEPSKGSNLLIVSVILLNIPFVLYDHAQFRFVYIFFNIFLTSYTIYSLLGLKQKNILSNIFNSCVTWPLSNMNCSAHAVKASAKNGKGKNVISIICGLLISAVLVAILSFLLMAADAAFEGMIDLISESILETASQHFAFLILGVPFAMIAYGMLYGGKIKRNCELVKPVQGDKFKLMPFTFAAAVFVPIVILYILYIVSQGAYLFSAFSRLLPESYTYSEYARRGFFELCGISVINIVLITILNVFAKSGSKANEIFHKIITLFICMMSLVMISTAIAKMVMYISIYGLSVKRTYTTMFMIGLAVVFVLIIVKGFCKKLDLIKVSAIVLTVMVIASSYIDVDRLTASYNLNAYKNGDLQSFDFYMLCSMSDSTLTYLIEYAEEAPASEKYEAKDILRIKSSNIKEDGLTLTGFNFSTLSALRAVEDAHLAEPRQ